MIKKLSVMFLSVICVFLVMLGITANKATKADSSVFVTDGSIISPTDYDYSFAVIGDTQCLVPSYANFKYDGDENTTIEWEGKTYTPVSYDKWKYYSHDTYVKVYDYVIDNAQSKNIAHVFGLGDITERASCWEWVQTGCPYAPDEEFTVAQEQISRMNGVVDYSLVRGNHETLPYFDKYFGTGEKASASGYAELVDEVYVHPAGFVDYSNTIHYFSAGEQDYMVVLLDYGASDAVLNWANEKIKANPYKNVIISTHAYMAADGKIIDDNGTNPKWDKDGLVYNRSNINHGKDMWDDLVSQHANVSMVLCGHEVTSDVLVKPLTGVNGNTVQNILIDPQQMDLDYANTGGVGAVAMFYLSNEGKTAEIRYWSTAKSCYINISTPTIQLNTVDADWKVLNELIAELPEVSSLTKQDAVRVNQAKEIYDKMSNTNKAKVTNVTKLNQAISKMQGVVSEHTITWEVDGQTFTSTAKYGDFPQYNGETIYKYGYVFDGWTPNLATVTEDVTYTAKFNENSVWDGNYPSIVNGYTFSGQGTKDNPWLIQNAQDLAALSALSYSKDYGTNQEYYKLTVNIDLSASDWQPICCDIEVYNNDWTTWYKFGANFDGDNHTITINTTTYKFAFGLFGAINGSVSNLILDGEINTPGYGGAGYNGVLASRVYNGATFTNVINKANITSAGNQIGGLIGNADNEAVVTFTNCHNQGNINSIGSFVGGILGGGWASIKLNDCSNSGNVNGVSNVGGLIGELFLQGKVENSTNTGTVKAGSYIATENTGNGNALFVGNLVGKDNLSPITVSVWDGVYPEDITNYTFEGQGTEANPYLIKTATDLAALSKISRVTVANNLFGAGVYYKLTADMDMTAGVWIPISYAQDRSGSNWGWGYFCGSFDGDGHTIVISTDVSSAKTVDGLTLQTYGYGLFEGLNNGAIVKNLVLQGNMQAGNRVGAVAYIAKADNSSTTTTISNVKNYINVTATINDGWVAGLIGSSSGKISIINCYNYGSITGLENTAGIIGDTWGNITLTNVVNEGVITGSKNVGGLVGVIQAGSASVTLDNCSSVKTIIGNSNVGQFIGSNSNKTHMVTFDVDGNKTTLNFGYGTDIKYDVIPTKLPDAQYAYTFANWDKEFSPVLGDITYTAIFNTTLNIYTITWVVEQNSFTTEVNYGDTPIYSGVPTKDSDGIYTYTFTGWAPEVVTVVGNATYTAQFSKEAIFISSDSSSNSSTSSNVSNSVINSQNQSSSSSSVSEIISSNSSSVSQVESNVSSDISSSITISDTEQTSIKNSISNSQTTGNSNKTSNTRGGCNSSIGYNNMILLLVCIFVVFILIKKSKNS